MQAYRQPLSETLETERIGMQHQSRAEYLKKGTLRQRKWRRNHPEARRSRHQRYGAKLKLLVFGHYSPFLMCARCGCTDIRVLTIDHIEGGGCVHRRTVLKRSGGTQFYVWLKRNGYPSGFQVLCMNCNWIKRLEQPGRPKT